MTTGLSDVAVCFSGWLNVNIPQNGATARRNVIDALAADVFIAGTYDATASVHYVTDCPRRRDTSCLQRKIAGLQPITRAKLDPMLTYAQLVQLVRQAVHWPAINRSFDPSKVRNGLTVWAPVLGARRLSVLRELHDLSRVHDLFSQHEEWRGFKYERIVWTRLEHDFFAPHPQLDVLTPADIVWTPPVRARNPPWSRVAFARAKNDLVGCVR